MKVTEKYTKVTEIYIINSNVPQITLEPLYMYMCHSQTINIYDLINIHEYSVKGMKNEYLYI